MDASGTFCSNKPGFAGVVGLTLASILVALVASISLVLCGLWILPNDWIIIYNSSHVCSPLFARIDSKLNNLGSPCFDTMSQMTCIQH
jgi:ABC-type multidrug transport system permease subunit